MSKAADEIESLLKIHGDHQLSQVYGKTDEGSQQLPYVDHRSGVNEGLISYSAAWCVKRPGYKMPDAGYPDYNSQRFNHGRPDREKVRLEVIAWAQNRYAHLIGGENTEWKRSPFGGYHPAIVIDRLNVALKVARKATQS